MAKEKILISACLIGDKVKYDGKTNLSPYIQELLEKYELIPFCVEVEGGLSIPRIPSERRREKVINKKGKDVTKYFNRGVDLAINIVNYLGIKIAILKEFSPSCGVKEIYDGSFNNRKKKGAGVLTEALLKRGIKVISSEDIASFLKEEN